MARWTSRKAMADHSTGDRRRWRRLVSGILPAVRITAIGLCLGMPPVHAAQAAEGDATASEEHEAEPSVPI